MKRGTNIYEPANPKAERELDEREYEILRFVGRCKYATHELARPYFSHTVAPPIRGKKTNRIIDIIMGELFHKGRYLDRPHYISQYELHGKRKMYGKGRPFTLYSLTHKGRDALIAWRPDLEEDIKEHCRIASHKNKVFVPNLLHYMMVNRFFVSLSLALKNIEGKLTHFSFEGPAMDAKIRNKYIQVIPDFTARFEIMNPAGEMKPSQFFLEAERNVTPEMFRIKVAKYIALYSAKVIEKQLGFERFRILVVTNTENQRDSWRRIAAKSKAPELFWLAWEQDFSPNEPNSLWSGIWVTGESEEPISLLPSWAFQET